MLLLADIAQAGEIGRMTAAATALATACWPGGLTVVVPQRTEWPCPRSSPAAHEPSGCACRTTLRRAPWQPGSGRSRRPPRTSPGGAAHLDKGQLIEGHVAARRRKSTRPPSMKFLPAAGSQCVRGTQVLVAAEVRRRGHRLDVALPAARRGEEVVARVALEEQAQTGVRSTAPRRQIGGGSASPVEARDDRSSQIQRTPKSSRSRRCRRMQLLVSPALEVVRDAASPVPRSPPAP